MTDFTTSDVLAFIWFVLCYGGYSYSTRAGMLRDSGLPTAIQLQRERWMHTMATRDMRMVDMLILDNLTRGNAFFASTAIIVLGGLTAMFGAAKTAESMIENIPLLHATSEFAWQIKVLFLMGIFIMAFFKFAWAFRLSHYTAILIGATPVANGDNEEECLRCSEGAARLAGGAGEHANAGLRAYYFGMAGFGWFLHPLALAVAATWVVAVMYRREYMSRALNIISNQPR